MNHQVIKVTITKTYLFLDDKYDMKGDLSLFSRVISDMPDEGLDKIGQLKSRKVKAERVAEFNFHDDASPTPNE